MSHFFDEVHFISIWTSSSPLKTPSPKERKLWLTGHVMAHTGEIRDIIPTNKQAMWAGVAIYRFSGGEIEEIRDWNDGLGIMRQTWRNPHDE